MTLSLDYIRKKMGWCPSAQPLRIAPSVIATPPVTITSAQPEGGAGGSGRIDRGVDLALGSLLILIRNRRLLWFTLMSGLVLTFSLIATFGLQYISGITPLTGSGLVTGPRMVLVVQGSPIWLALTFACQWIATFGIAILLAGLIACVSLLLSGRTVTMREGLSSAGKHLRPVAGWATVLAVVGTVQSVVMNQYPGNISLIFLSVLISIPLGILTIFVIPVIVLENRGLVGAIAESVSLIRKTWGEILVCFFVYIVLWFIVAIVTLIPVAALAFPSGNPALISLFSGIYLIILMLMIILYMTADGIFLVGLFTYAKTGRIPEAFFKSPGRGP